MCVGGALASGLLLDGYRRGLFAMGVRLRRREVLGWFSPDPRGVLEPAAVHESRSLRRSSRRFETRVDCAFDEVVAACADPARDGAWIDGRYARAYRELYDAGLAHSVETWAGGRLVGGLFGVALGGLFAAESKFHRETDASKHAVVALCRLLAADPTGPRLVDVQWSTPHLETLGVTELTRSGYLARLPALLATPSPAGLSRPGPVEVPPPSRTTTS
ncbi:leucyl/phenylalanyl-tRNA--protein transferase [Aquipuribacter nitratireducens]|uniref:Leucyl/phenylalanyl-tRNA--protein transferase n=1 Tax=Aquipuribacter nitratireducens TaxID=650104 RepID=A0ABW0GMZ2_9MICO